MSSTNADPRIGKAIVGCLDAADRAADAGRSMAMRHALSAAAHFLDLNRDPVVAEMAIDRMLRLARRFPCRETDEAVAAAEAIIGPRGHA